MDIIAPWFSFLFLHDKRQRTKREKRVILINWYIQFCIIFIYRLWFWIQDSIRRGFIPYFIKSYTHIYYSYFTSSLKYISALVVFLGDWSIVISMKRELVELNGVTTKFLQEEKSKFANEKANTNFVMQKGKSFCIENGRRWL